MSLQLTVHFQPWCTPSEEYDALEMFKISSDPMDTYLGMLPIMAFEGRSHCGDQIFGGARRGVKDGEDLDDEAHSRGDITKAVYRNSGSR